MKENLKDLQTMYDNLVARLRQIEQTYPKGAPNYNARIRRRMEVNAISHRLDRVADSQYKHKELCAIRRSLANLTHKAVAPASGERRTAMALAFERAYQR